MFDKSPGRKAQLMRELDDREAFIATEAEKIAQGLSFERLPEWADSSWHDAIAWEDVLDRYMTLELKAEQVLTRPNRGAED
jgi:hypothetical protein